MDIVRFDTAEQLADYLGRVVGERSRIESVLADLVACRGRYALAARCEGCGSDRDLIIETAAGQTAPPNFRTSERVWYARLASSTAGSALWRGGWSGNLALWSGAMCTPWKA